MKAREYAVVAAVAALLASTTGCSQEVNSKLAADDPTPSTCARKELVPFAQVATTHEEAEANASLVVDAEVVNEKVMLVKDDPDRLPPPAGEEALEEELVQGKAKIAKWSLRVVRWVRGDGPQHVFGHVGLGGEGISGSGAAYNRSLVDLLEENGVYRTILVPNPFYKNNFFEVSTARPLDECDGK